MRSRASSEIGQPLGAIFLFSIHVLVGGLLFAMIALMGSLLYLGTSALAQSCNLPEVLVGGMRALEILLFAVDGVCFAFLVVWEGVGFIRQLLFGGRQ